LRADAGATHVQRAIATTAKLGSAFFIWGTVIPDGMKSLSVGRRLRTRR
jgi:hypothetical protein